MRLPSLIQGHEITSHLSDFKNFLYLIRIILSCRGTKYSNPFFVKKASSSVVMETVCPPHSGTMLTAWDSGRMAVDAALDSPFIAQVFRFHIELVPDLTRF